MNRTIEFRGKRIDNGEWVYGDLYTNDCTEIIVHDGYRAESYYPVDSDTVGQFTGLTDKNGNEIYEDDIVSAPFAVVRIVFGMGSFHLNTRYGSTHYFDGWADMLGEFEVIGNIHDNHELMEGGEKK